VICTATPFMRKGLKQSRFETDFRFEMRCIAFVARYARQHIFMRKGLKQSQFETLTFI